LIDTQLFSALCVSEKPCRFLKEASLYVSVACTSFAPLPGNSETEEMSVTSIAEEYVVSTLTALATRRLRRTRACMRRALDCYPKKVLRTVNPMKLKNKKQCSFSEEPVKTKDVDKEDYQRQAMEKPAKVKTVTWMLRGATKAMSTRKAKTAKVVPRVTPMRNKWRIWDPGQSEAAVLRRVIVSIKHVRCSVSYTERIPCPGGISTTPSRFVSGLALAYK
jgi:hypothetical protein